MHTKLRVSAAITIIAIGLVFSHVLQAQSLLWKITGNDIPAPSYLYGTVHLTDPRVFEWKDTVYKRLDQCKAFAAELDLSVETMIRIAGMMMLPEGQTLHDRFTDEEYALIRDAVKKCSGLELSVFDKIKPPALIAICFANKKPGDLQATVDELLYQHAQSKDIATYGIETVEEQVALFDKIPPEYIVEYFRNIDEQDREFQTLIECYLKADLDSILILIQDAESGSLLNNELIRERNFRMVDRIIPLIKAQSVFVAVGSGHLPGDDGIIALLRREGYRVMPELLK